MKFWPSRKPKLKSHSEQTRLRQRASAMARRKMLQIIPPEGVVLELPIASAAARFGAQLLDVFITVLIVVIFLFSAAFAFQGSFTFFATLTFVLLFFVRLPYYIVSELVWNGRTIAKRLIGLRVVSRDGRSLSTHQVVIRNLMREVEFYAPLIYALNGAQLHWSIAAIAWLWILLLIILVWRSKHSQRIGDIIANTAVISDPKPVLLPDMAANTGPSWRSAQEERFTFSTAQLDQYGRYELQVLENVLRASRSTNAAAQKKQQAYFAEIVQRICSKIDFEETIAPAHHLEFLRAFYAAQRAHLEQRKLYGDVREDKFFGVDSDVSKP